MHNAINGQVFWQSGTAGLSGQHGMSSGIADMDISEAAAIAGPLTGAVNWQLTVTVARSVRRSMSPTPGISRNQISEEASRTS